MQHHLDEFIHHVARSQEQLSNILHFEREVTTHMAQLVFSVPDTSPTFPDVDALVGSSSELNKSIAAYLSSLADLEEALASNLAMVMKALAPPPSESNDE